MLYENIKKLVQYGIETGLTPACEKIMPQIFCWMYLRKTNIQRRRKNMVILIWRKC